MTDHKLREALARAVEGDHWIAEIKSADGDLLRRLKDEAFVSVSVDQGFYVLMAVTEQGLEQYQRWTKPESQ